jgi:Ca2+/H+ antiporter, TMEM165/GDT1 family
MTVLSAVFGMVFIQFLPPNITRWVSVLLFVVFGLKMLHEGYNMTASGAAEELEEVQHDIRKREDEVSIVDLSMLHDAFLCNSLNK